MASGPPKISGQQREAPKAVYSAVNLIKHPNVHTLCLRHGTTPDQAPQPLSMAYASFWSTTRPDSTNI